MFCGVDVREREDSRVMVLDTGGGDSEGGLLALWGLPDQFQRRETRNLPEIPGTGSQPLPATQQKVRVELVK